MQRRKLLAAVGSFAAGGAAMMGTGAVSQFNSGDRSIRAEVVGDKSAYVALQKPPTNGGNNSGRSDPADPSGETRHGNFVEFNNDKLSLDFGKQSSARSGDPQQGNSLGGTGVNPGSTYYFDDTFVIRNLGNNSGAAVGELEAYIKESISGIMFYKGTKEGDRTELNENNPLTNISPGSAKSVGVKIVADNLPQDTTNDSFQVVAENPNNDA
jgi:hypothetical protein